MIKIFKNATAAILLTVVCLSAFAQKKELTGDQYFKSNFKGIAQPLPNFIKWIGDNQFV